MWDRFCHGLGMKIGNGQLASFWFDNWVETNAPLICEIPGLEGVVPREEKVAEYVTPWGGGIKTNSCVGSPLKLLLTS